MKLVQKDWCEWVWPVWIYLCSNQGHLHTVINSGGVSDFDTVPARLGSRADT